MPPPLSRRQLREIDRLCTEQFAIPSILLMENAARSAADVACELLTNFSDPPAENVLILCGGGNNGGDGLAVARHLHNRGHAVRIALTVDPGKYRGDALINYRIAQAMALAIESANPSVIAAARPRLIIDAIFGTGLTAAPRDPFPQIAAAVAATGIPVLAIDIPSGLDCDTGSAPGSAIRAAATITFVAEKIGFAAPAARPYLGSIHIGDIGAPRELVDRIFAEPH